MRIMEAMKIKVLLLGIVILALISGGSTQVQRDIQLNARVDSRCKIELSSHTVSFTRVRPDVERLIPQNEVPLRIIVKTTTRPGEKVYLRIKAEEDLVDSETGYSIEAKNISWECSGKGFKKGNLSTRFPQKVGHWNKSGVWKGTLTFYLKNRRDYAPGIYRVRVNLSVSSF